MNHPLNAEINRFNLRMWAIQVAAAIEQPDMDTLIDDAQMLEAFVLEAQAGAIEAEMQSEVDLARGRRH